MSKNKGRIIKDFFCNGFFGREYQLEGAVVEKEGKDWVVVRAKDGYPYYAFFSEDWSKQDLLDEWCAERNEEDYSLL